MNENLKELTQEQIIQEVIKCKKDVIYYIENYVKIIHPVKGLILFKLYDFQKDFIYSLKDNRFNIVLKSRQTGVSTASAAYATWLATFHNAKKILVIAHKGEAATNFINIIKTIIDNVPSFLRPKIKVNNRQSLEFINNSIIKATTTTRDAGRSEAISLLICDEAAMMPNAKDIWTAASPTLSTGGGAVIISTPKGVGNFFHEIYSKAIQKLNEFNPVQIPWHLDPTRDEKWKEETLRNIGEVMFAQEYDCDFLRSGNTVIDQNSLMWYKKEGHIVDPIQKTNFDNNLWIWKYPDYSKHYMISCDVARGDGSDYSAAQITCIEDMEQVAEYKGKIPTNIFGHLLAELGIKYNKALLIPENNSYGWAVIQKILELNYPNLYWSQKHLVYVDVNNWGSESGDKVPGIYNEGQKMRPLIINAIEEAIRTHSLIFHSIRLYEELTTFVYNEKTGKPEAAKGYHDDLVIATAIGIFVRSTGVKLLEVRQNMYDTMPEMFSNSKVEFGLSFNKMTKQQNDTFKVGKEDIKWVIM